MGDETVEQNASRHRFLRAGDQFQERGFAAGVGSEDGDDLSRASLEAAGFESEKRSLRGIRGISVTHLLDTEANVARARTVGGGGGSSHSLRPGAQAILRRSK